MKERVYCNTARKASKAPLTQLRQRFSVKSAEILNCTGVSRLEVEVPRAQEEIGGYVFIPPNYRNFLVEFGKAPVKPITAGSWYLVAVKPVIRPLRRVCCLNASRWKWRRSTLPYVS